MPGRPEFSRPHGKHRPGNQINFLKFFSPAQPDSHGKYKPAKIGKRGPGNADLAVGSAAFPFMPAGR
jgi:hypothetical protein